MASYRRWGRGRQWIPERRLSVLELVRSGTLDLKLASLFWLIMGQRASVLVAAGPSFAGKTTTLNVMLDFLPPSVNQITLNGSDEDFGFLKDAEAPRTYMIAEEFSEYMDYVWGEAAQRAFQLLTEGYGLGGTIHARTAKEALLVLHEYLEVPVEALSALGAVVMIRATPGRLYGSQPVRRVESVSLVLPHEKGIAIQPIASRESATIPSFLPQKRPCRLRWRRSSACRVLMWRRRWQPGLECWRSCRLKGESRGTRCGRQWRGSMNPTRHDPGRAATRPLRCRRGQGRGAYACFAIFWSS